QLLDAVASPLRRELGSARKDAGDTDLGQTRAPFLEPEGERIEQLRRREHALDVVTGRQDRDRLIDAVLLVLFEVFHPPLLDQLHDPARIEIDAEADAAAILTQMLDRQTQPTRTRRTEHQPVRPL